MVRLSHVALIALGFSAGIFVQSRHPLLFTPHEGSYVEVYSHQFKKDNWKEA